MGNKNEVVINSIGKENFIQEKKLKGNLTVSSINNFFYDILPFPEEEKIILSSTKQITIVGFNPINIEKKLEIKNLKVLQRNYKNVEKNKQHIYSFYACKEGSYALIMSISINFNDYTFEIKEIIRKHMPKCYFLNFFVLSIDLIVIAFNKGTIMIFDKPEINNKDNKIILLPTEKERQIFKYNHEINLNEQQESCNFFEVSDTCFIAITSMGSLRFYDFIESKREFVVNNYMEGYWANPHSKNSIILLGNKLICAYKSITIIDVNKRLILQQIKSQNINSSILYLQNHTILLVSGHIINNNTKDIKKFISLSQYVIAEEEIDEKGNKSLKQYNYSSGDLEGLSKVKTLSLISEKSILKEDSNIITNCIEFFDKIIIFSSNIIKIIQ